MEKSGVEETGVCRQENHERHWVGNLERQKEKKQREYIKVVGGEE